MRTAAMDTPPLGRTTTEPSPSRPPGVVRIGGAHVRSISPGTERRSVSFGLEEGGADPRGNANMAPSEVEWRGWAQPPQSSPGLHLERMRPGKTVAARSPSADRTDSGFDYGKSWARIQQTMTGVAIYAPKHESLINPATPAVQNANFCACRGADAGWRPPPRWRCRLSQFQRASGWRIRSAAAPPNWNGRGLLNGSTPFWRGDREAKPPPNSPMPSKRGRTFSPLDPADRLIVHSRFGLTLPTCIRC